MDYHYYYYYSHACDRVDVLAKCVDELGGAQVPEAHLLVVAAGDEQRVLVVDVDVAYRLTRTAQCDQEQAVQGSPHLDQLVVRCLFAPQHNNKHFANILLTFDM